MQARCALLILSYKNKSFLEALLPTVEELVLNTKNYLVEVIVVENGTDKESEQYVRTQFQHYRFIQSENNYLFSLNSVAREVHADYIFILNNDLMLHPDVLNSALPLLEKDPELFAVSCTLMNWEGTQIQYNRSKARVERGWLFIDYEPDQLQLERNIFYACGGASIYRRSMYNELKGFDRIYYPAYYEDTDLSHKAWNRGWKSVNHPKAVVYHCGGGSWTTEKKKNQLLRLQQRNRIIGMVRNVRTNNFLLFFFMALPYRLLFNSKLGKNYYLGLLYSLPRLPLALFHRFREKTPPNAHLAFLNLPDTPYRQL